MGINREAYLGDYASDMSQTAVDYAKEFERDFDYTGESIKDLEAILDYYSKDIKVAKPTENQIWSMSTIFGAYLGETMLRTGLGDKGFYWGQDDEDEILLLVNDSDSYFSPIHKVYKRLVNGEEDNVISFYDVMMDIE